MTSIVNAGVTAGGTSSRTGKTILGLMLVLGLGLFLSGCSLFGGKTSRAPIAANERAVWAVTEGEKLLARNGKRSKVTTTASGLQYEVMRSGDRAGPMPRPQDSVRAHYEGATIDRVTFDSSYLRGKPAEFPVGALIPGWIEALQLMRPGDVWKLWVPSKLAYGERGQPGSIGPNETLVFQIELIDVIPASGPGSRPIQAPPGTESPR